MTAAKQNPSAPSAPSTRFSKITSTVKASSPSIGADLKWVNMSDLIDQTLLFLEVQRQKRSDAERGDYEVFVCTFRHDDDSMDPIARLSTSNVAVFGQIETCVAEGKVPFVATIRKRTGKTGRSGYYILEPLDTEAETTKDFPF